jgi:hypothetical protein
MNYAFKFLRYIHAQMSANPPSVTPRPTSADHKDRRSADVADDMVVYLRRHYKLQDRVDLTSLQTLAYGSGFFKTAQDPLAGEVLEIDEQAGTLVMSGDLLLRPLLIWDVALDPVAQHEDDLRFWFQRHMMSVDEAKFRFPEYADELDRYVEKSGRTAFWDKDADGSTATQRVAIWEYIEKGMPINGMAGRRMFLLESGKALSPVQPNPNPDAELGLHTLTDIDVPGQVYGKTFVDYIRRLQDVLNRLDSTVLDNVQAHGVVRMVTYDASETQDGLPSNAGWQIVNLKGTAAQKPDFINPPTLMPDLYKFREQLLAAMSELAGVNDSMFGQVKREMSGFSMQTAIDAGNMVRRRLFNKYKNFVEGIYRSALGLIKENWSDARKILVTGQEGAMSVAYYSGADIAGGFDLDVEYGASFSLDPASRREEIMQIMPMLKEAGYSMKQILGMLRLNDIGGLFDMAEVASRRQLEIFDEMISKYEESGVPVYIKPEDLEEHQGMLAAAYEFRMSMAFKVLPRELRLLIDQHIKDREQLAAKAAAPGAAGASAGPAAPAGALPALGLGPQPGAPEALPVA